MVYPRGHIGVEQGFLVGQPGLDGGAFFPEDDIFLKGQAEHAECDFGYMRGSLARCFILSFRNPEERTMTYRLMASVSLEQRHGFIHDLARRFFLVVKQVGKFQKRMKSPFLMLVREWSVQQCSEDFQ